MSRTEPPSPQLDLASSLDIVLNRFVRDTFAYKEHGINQSATQTGAERQVAEALAVERESLRPE